MPSQPFPPDPESVRGVRLMIRREIPWADTSDVELVASELVTNVIRHAKTNLVVSLEVGKERVRIEVMDGSAIMPAARDLSMGIDGTGGAGLVLVEAFSESWGVDQRPDGKVVWAEIAIGQTSTEETRSS
jgi:anti-sigma regulatory factor (Ser/Thr protein kinase)